MLAPQKLNSEILKMTMETQEIREHTYHDPRKIITDGNLLYSSPGFGRFLGEMPRVSNDDILVGIRGLLDDTWAVEITDNEVFGDFAKEYRMGWLLAGGTAYLYSLPKNKRKKCTTSKSEFELGIHELEYLVDQNSE